MDDAEMTLSGSALECTWLPLVNVFSFARFARVSWYMYTIVIMHKRVELCTQFYWWWPARVGYETWVVFSSIVFKALVVDIFKVLLLLLLHRIETYRAGWWLHLQHYFSTNIL